MVKHIVGTTVGFFILLIGVIDSAEHMKESIREHYRLGMIHSFLCGMCSVGIGIALILKTFDIEIIGILKHIIALMCIPLMIFGTGYYVYLVFDVIKRVFMKQADSTEESCVWFSLLGIIIFLCYNGIMRLLGE